MPCTTTLRHRFVDWISSTSNPTFFPAAPVAAKEEPTDEVLGAELGPKGIRVNAVSPASVPTPGALGLNSKEVYEKRAASIPLRRNGTEEDNSNAIAFLLSKEAGFINGEILNVDGGVAASM